MDSDDSVSAKRRKTEVDGNDNNDDQAEIREDSDSYLLDFLSKKPQNNLTLFQRVIKNEEAEAKERDPSEDLKLYHDACADFSDCIAEIADLKTTKPEGWKESINDIRKEAGFITLIMKKLNRVEKTRTKITREKVSKEKQQVDVARVKLDNLLSEILHLRKEIDKCLKFRSKPLGIDLVSVNEFYEKAPPLISKPEITQSDDHQLQLARLEWELRQRKVLSSLLSDLENKRSSVSEQIDKKEKDLTSIAPLVNDVLVVSQPLKEKLGSSFSESSKISEQAYLLPDPLYFLYVQASAFRDVSDKDLSLEIKGNFNEAQKFKNSSGCKESEKVETSKEGSQKKNLELERTKLCLKHPLTVHLKFSVKDGFLFELEFSFFTNLNIATVKSTVTAPSGLKMPASSDILLNPKNLLHNLFSGDSGAESPNLMNYYQMQKIGLESLPLEKMGLPYIWAQKLVGLNFVGQNHRINPKQDVCRSNLPVVINELKKRCLCRISLLSLVTELEQDELTPPASMKQIKLCSHLNSIKGITWTEYCEDSMSESFKNSPCASPNNLYFKGHVTRGEAKLLFLVIVNADYPLSPNTFTFKIDYEPLNLGNRVNNFAHEIEREVNVFWKELISSRSQALFSLSYQLFKAMVCFDIVLETLQPQHFSSNKHLESTFRGRTRSLPFKYLPEENMFVHQN